MRVVCSAIALLLGMAIASPAATIQPPAGDAVAPTQFSDRSFGGPRADWYGDSELLLALSNNDINQRASQFDVPQNHIMELGDGPVGTLLPGDARYKKLYEQLAAVPSLQLLWNGSPGLTYPPTQFNFPRSYTTPTTYGGFTAFSSDIGGAGANNFDPPPPPPEDPPTKLIPVPEPTTGVLFGLAGLWLVRRRR